MSDYTSPQPESDTTMTIGDEIYHFFGDLFALYFKM